MNVKTILFELLSQGLLAVSGAWLLLMGYAGPGLLIVSGVLFALTMLTRAKQIISHLAPFYMKLDPDAASILLK